MDDVRRRQQRRRRRRRRRMARGAGLLALIGLLAVGSSALALNGSGVLSAPSHARRHHRVHVRGDRRREVSAPRAAGRRGISGAARRRAAGRPVTVRLAIDARARGLAVPPGFFGMSFEYWGLADDERHPLLLARLLALLHAHGTGPMTVRIGGNSSQQTFLATGHRPHLPRWAYGVGRRWITRTARLIGRDHLRVIPDLNQITGDPTQAAALAGALEHGLPRHSIAGFELGNEPDIYQRPTWDEEVHRFPSLAAALPAQITPGDVAADYLADADALNRVAPRVPLLGPVVAEPRVDHRFVDTLLASPHPRLSAITVHQYPYNPCAPRNAADYPTIARLLSHHALGVMRGNLRAAVATARHAHLPLRVTEFNSATCGGRLGVSNTFATGLWAPGALLEMAASGVRSADLHARAIADNSPFRWDHVGLAAKPLLYGLLMFVRALGPGAHLVPTRVRGAQLSRVNAWTVRLRSGSEHVVVLNRGNRDLAVVLRAARGRRATVQRLLAPGVRAVRGVTLAGQRLSNRARWVGRRVVTRVAGHRGRFVVRVPAGSAALVTLAGR